jgi:hypothetical protein
VTMVQTVKMIQIRFVKKRIAPTIFCPMSYIQNTKEKKTYTRKHPMFNIAKVKALSSPNFIVFVFTNEINQFPPFTVPLKALTQAAP